MGGREREGRQKQRRGESSLAGRPTQLAESVPGFKGTRYGMSALNEEQFDMWWRSAAVKRGAAFFLAHPVSPLW